MITSYPYSNSHQMELNPHQLLINLAVLMKRPTGISTYCLNLLPHLKHFAPTLLAAQPIADYTYYPIPDGQTPEQGVKGHLRRLIWTQVHLPQIYQQLKSQLIFSPLPEAPLFSDSRFVVMVHDLIPLRFPQMFSPMTYYCRYYIPQVLSQAQHIICNSVATAQDIREFFNIDPQKITPIPLAYDTNNFRFMDLPTKNYFLYIGRLNPHKNLQRLITAFASLPNFSDGELWLVGPKDRRYSQILIEQVKELELTKRVKFLEYVPYPELPILINQAIALIFPSLWEGFGLPVLEAMGCGTPVITSNLASLPEITLDAALLVNPYNINEIRLAMETIVNSSAWRSRLRQQGLARAREFSWALTGEKTAAILAKYL